MPRWAQRDALRDRPRRAWAFDAAVTLFALLCALYAYMAAYAVSDDEPAAALGWAIVLAMVAPLPLRRVWPVPTYAVVLAVAVTTGWWAEHLVLTPPLAIGLFTVAARCSRRATLGCLLPTELVVVAWASRLYPDGRSWLSEALSLAVAVAAVAALGMYVGTRRALSLELRDRALRLERERDQQAELSAAAERARIARELHDIVAHHLTVMVALADGAAAQAVRAPERSVAAMRTVSATGRQALTDTRRLLGVLRDAADDTGPNAGAASGATRSPLPGLADLTDLVAGVRAAGLTVRYQVVEELPRLDQGTQLALYRLVQEALTNTMKHAGAGASAGVRIGRTAHELCVEVDDDGGGVAAPGVAAPGAGRGLPGMRERIAAVGGEITSGPTPHRGWAVRVRLPLVDVATPVDAS
ncbi:Signal transduction histidine kinase [Jatrophihabitans endophyticus]|uniref:histidine kinase n=1 Tax=Jatrophihabitans endophyticus TaxID=1206085 RepID=A0A1M5DVZ8_9ACTN|nr:histidine kinase [Jatrophihabitans endophyticus]SHF71218.1 Signal transduction histidine kinase [Jatrophihabitans endophyticus]